MVAPIPKTAFAASLVLATILPGSSGAFPPPEAWAGENEAALIAWGHTIAMQGNGLPGNTACAECHRINGGGMPSVGIPRIAGQTETYIYREIRGVQKGTRYSPYMDGIVQNLSRRDIRAVALYYSTVRTPKLHDPAEFDPSLGELGRRIAHRGLWDRNIPAI